MSSIFSDLKVLNDLTVLNDLRIFGDLDVRGTTTSVNSTVVNIADNFLYLNKNLIGGVKSGGIVINIGSIGTQSTTLKGEGFSADFVDVESGSPWSIGNFIQVSGAADSENNGLYQITALQFEAGFGVDRITVSGVGSNFVQTGFTANPNDISATVTAVNISVIQSSATGILQFGSSSSVSTLNLESIVSVPALQAFVADSIDGVFLADGTVVMTGNINMGRTNDITDINTLMITGNQLAGSILHLSAGPNSDKAMIQASSGRQMYISTSVAAMNLSSNNGGGINIFADQGDLSLDGNNIIINTVTQDTNKNAFACFVRRAISISFGANDWVEIPTSSATVFDNVGMDPTNMIATIQVAGIYKITFDASVRIGSNRGTCDFRITHNNAGGSTYVRTGNLHQNSHIDTYPRISGISFNHIEELLVGDIVSCQMRVQTGPINLEDSSMIIERVMTST